MASYCEYVLGEGAETLHRAYHDVEYGFPLDDDALLFERLMLEINQAGLSWLTILRKREAFRAAYANFDITTVAVFGDEDRARLLADAGIIRNRLKINAAIENARRIGALREEHGSFRAWLDAQHPLPLDAWLRVFKQTFVFTGGEIVNEFLLSTGYLPGAHIDRCPVLPKVIAARPPWLEDATP